MHYVALATDYDGTLAEEGRVTRSALKALRRLKESGRKLLLVTGRELEDLLHVFPDAGLFDRIVVENGGLLYDPATRQERRLGDKPSPALIEALKKRRVKPLSVGRCIIATREPHETDVIQAIREEGLELQVIFNKGAVMILPPGVNKASGLRIAAAELGILPQNVVAVGDGENDHALLANAGCGAAVRTAIESLRDEADLVLDHGEGKGVEELIDALLADDLRQVDRKIKRHRPVIGRDDEEKPVRIGPRGTCLLIAGPSGSGKTSVTTAILEKILVKLQQFCVIDPEGDYSTFPGAVHLGDPQRVPTEQEAVDLLERGQNAVVSLLGVHFPDRRKFFSGLLARIQDLRSTTGRPHWLVLDEAHHLFPEPWQNAGKALPTEFEGIILVTVHPDKIARSVLEKVTGVIAVGDHPEETLSSFAKPVKLELPHVPKRGRKKLDVIAWFPAEHPRNAWRVRIDPGEVEHDRHRRKYAAGDLEEDAFFFRGPDRALNLRAQNLQLFTQIAEGVDDGTWLYHLRRHDYSKWIRKAIQDKDLAEAVERIERSGTSAAESRRAVREAIEQAYTAAA